MIAIMTVTPAFQQDTIQPELFQKTDGKLMLFLGPVHFLLLKNIRAMTPRRVRSRDTELDAHNFLALVASAIWPYNMPLLQERL
jgi:hypothetical protein